MTLLLWNITRIVRQDRQIESHIPDECFMLIIMEMASIIMAINKLKTVPAFDVH